MSAEFERQVENLAGRGYPRLAGMGEASFRRTLAPLEEPAARLDDGRGESGDGRLPFAVVVSRELVQPEGAAE